ncbi:probable ATP-dependent RNA helicase DDX49 [Orussus abietinus]|uniref:probable ATP-dependent RNA helicase DDX49 n=1 Tax=Orussus abietinus TaxID=222816 RepID=UPI000625ABD9|nr:probable ATP-dependent RNA helicase DDX49 [Orussus abietinus]
MSNSDDTFAQLQLNSWIVAQCKSIGISTPTPIQKNCIPRILAGDDCIGCAKTGSGKTLAFALPILQVLCDDPYGIFALVLTPSRELAFQIGDQFAAIGKPINLKKCVIVGGMDMVAQAQELAKSPHIVVATPGRLADHLESSDSFSLKRIKFLVVDEADRLLGGEFDGQMQTIFQALPKNKQSLFFSATITDTLNELKRIASKKVFTWEAQDDTGLATVKQLDQRYVLSSADARDATLVETVRTYRDNNNDGSIVIFTDTCKRCQLLSMMLTEIGFTNVALHSILKQKERTAALAKFKSNLVKILIATNVAARGLDIPTVKLIINHVLPNIPKEYIHRVGRTARSGREGMAISIITPCDVKLLQEIENTIGTKLTEYKVNDNEVVKIFTQVSIAKREAELHLDETDYFEKKIMYKRKKLIMEGKDPDEVEILLSKKKRKKKKSEAVIVRSLG